MWHQHISVQLESIYVESYKRQHFAWMCQYLDHTATGLNVWPSQVSRLLSFFFLYFLSQYLYKTWENNESCIYSQVQHTYQILHCKNLPFIFFQICYKLSPTAEFATGKCVALKRFPIFDAFLNFTNCAAY